MCERFYNYCMDFQVVWFYSSVFMGRIFIVVFFIEYYGVDVCGFVFVCGVWYIQVFSFIFVVYVVCNFVYFVIEEVDGVDEVVVGDVIQVAMVF